MHTSRVVIEGIGYYINHNGDWSGDVDIYKQDTGAGDKLLWARIPFVIMEEIVGRKMIDEAIGRLEQLSGKDAVRWATLYTDSE